MIRRFLVVAIVAVPFSLAIWYVAGTHGACPNSDGIVCETASESGWRECDGKTVIDDNALTKSDVDGLNKMIEANRHTDMKVLIEQLGRTECTLKLAPAPKKALASTAIYEESKKSVVMMCALFKCGKCNNWHNSIATGYVISADGAICTNYHVINDTKPQTIGVVTSDGKIYPVREVLAASKNDDIAIVKADLGTDSLTPLSLTPEAPVGSYVYIISHPVNQYYMFTSGMVSRYFTNYDQKGTALGPMMAVTAEYAKGSSGAPILNQNGSVVGMVSSTKSIYYTVDKGVEKDFQMVLRQCVMAESILKLVKTK